MSLILIERLDVIDIHTVDICIILAFKLTEERVYPELFHNTFGIDKNDLAKMEFNVCKQLRFNLFISKEEFDNKMNLIIKLTQ